MITKLMDGLPNRNMAQEPYDAAVSKYMDDLPVWGAQANALAADVNAKQAAAAGSAAAASGSAAASASSAVAAAGSAAAASSSAAAADGSAVAAAAAAASAAALAGAFTGTSASSLTIADGEKVFVTQAGEQYTPGIFMIAVSAANAANWMAGQVVSYAGTSLKLNITARGGSGTFADWNLSLAGIPGATGPTGSLTGGVLVGQLSELKAPNVASAATVNVWALAGNSATLTGTTAITSFGTAPQAGAKFTLIAGAVTPLTQGANLVLPGGLSYTTAVDDLIEIYADTTTRHIVSIKKKDGKPVLPLERAFNRVEILIQSGTYIAKVTGRHRITLKGADGSGGIAHTGSSNYGAAASGGATGGLCVLDVDLVVGDSLVVTHGASGAGVTTSGGGTPQALPGNAAGTSTITGPNVSMTANGGGGGSAVTGPLANTVYTANGAIGGTASGGTMNIQGANSGTASIRSGASSGVNGNAAATGGAAPPWRGARYASGDASVLGVGAGASGAASGGAGIGGKSGDAVNTTTTNTGVLVATAGGGSRGPSAAVTANNNVFSSLSGSGAVLSATEPPLELTGAGTAAVNGSVSAGPGRGAGSGAVFNAGTNLGNFGGSGGVVVTGGAIVVTGTGTYGASGAVAAIGAPNTLSTGAGGSAFTLIEYTI